MFAKSYTVYADYGYVTEEELYTTNNLKAAVKWAEKYVERHGLCGYDVIEVGWHSVDGEYHTEWRKTETEYA